MSARAIVGRWIEAMQILASSSDDPNREQRDEMRAVRNTMLDLLTDEVLTADGQDYPGELDMLRGLVATVRAVAEHGDLADVQRLLAEHAADDAEARAGRPDAESDGFFQPGHTYTRDHHASTIRFLVRRVEESPCGTYRVAFGWSVEDGDVTWSPFDSDDMDGWTDATGEVTR